MQNAHVRDVHWQRQHCLACVSFTLFTAGIRLATLLFVGMSFLHGPAYLWIDTVIHSLLNVKMILNGQDKLLSLFTVLTNETLVNTHLL